MGLTTLNVCVRIDSAPIEEAVKTLSCRNGEIGRRPGLKIPCNVSYVPVRARFPAFSLKRIYRGIEQSGSSSGS